MVVVVMINMMDIRRIPLGDHPAGDIHLNVE